MPPQAPPQQAPPPPGGAYAGHGAFKAPAPAPAGRSGRRSLAPAWLDLKATIAIVIGLISFSGALLTWHAANLSSTATGADRQSVLQTVSQQQNSVAVETQLRNEEAAFVRFKTDYMNAQKMRAEADQLRAAKNDAAARQLDDDANRLENLANVASSNADLSFITYDKDSVPQFDENARRQTLINRDETASQAHPDEQAQFADRTRHRAERLVTFLPIFVLAIAILTVAQLMQRDALRPVLLGVGSAVWLIALVVALLGDKA